MTTRDLATANLLLDKCFDPRLAHKRQTERQRAALRFALDLYAGLARMSNRMVLAGELTNATVAVS